MNEPLLLLPGMMCDARLFTQQIECLSTSRAIMVAPLIDQSSIEDLAQGVLQSAPRKFALAGLSMGGIVAMEMISQAPERITRLALLDTNPLAENETRRTLRDEQIERVAQGGLQKVMRDEMKPNYLAKSANQTAILQLCMQMAQALGPKVFTSQSLALRNRADQTATLRAVKVPSLVLCGEHDTLCPLERHQLMQQLISGSRLRVIPNAGHLPPVEQSRLTTDQLAAWLTW